jgi:hypothetical protein
VGFHSLLLLITTLCRFHRERAYVSLMIKGENIGM